MEKLRSTLSDLDEITNGFSVKILIKIGVPLALTSSDRTFPRPQKT